MTGRLVYPASYLSRRQVLRGAGVGIAGLSSAVLFGCGSGDGSRNALPRAGEEPPPEVTTIKLKRSYYLCVSPLYLAKDFLLEEGFTDVQYLPLAKLSAINKSVESGFLDISMNYAAPVIYDTAHGAKVVSVGGVHVGCFEIFAREGIDSIGDLAGKRIAIVQSDAREPDYLFVTTLLRFIGVSAEHELLAFNESKAPTVLDDGLADAIVAFPPLSQQLRTLGSGHVILNSIRDQPFASYLCCLLILRPEFIEKYPVATKRALRAIYRAADFCARDPEAAAAKLVADGFARNPVYALETVTMGRYGQWRDYDPEETMRFYALRLRDAGMISSDPESLIKGYTDWRFHDLLKGEMAFALPAFDPAAFAISCGEGGVSS